MQTRKSWQLDSADSYTAINTNFRFSSVFSVPSVPPCWVLTYA